MDSNEIRSIKWKYTFKALFGFGFLAAVLVIIFWLFFVYEVRNFLGIIAILIFLVIPAIKSALTIPNELKALKLIWKSDDPEALSEALGDLRENEIL